MDIQTIAGWNVLLARRYGMRHGHPRFRMVWTNDHFEVRKGTFGQILNGNVIGTVEDVRKVHKYSYMLDRWLLEELTVNNAIPTEILDQKLISYEPRLCFEDKDTREYREPNFLEVDQACYYAVNKTLKGHVPTEEQLRKAEQSLISKRVKAFREQIDEAIPDTAHALVHGHGIIVPSTFKRNGE